MALSYYDDAIIAKLKKWMPDDNRIRVLGPDETKRFFETRADDTNDAPVQLPLITLSRNKDIEILSTIKQLKSFNGLFIMAPNDRNLAIPEKSVVLNVIPVKTTYQLDIYAKTRYEAEEYVRNFLFKIINNPQIIVQVPYNNIDDKHTANLRVLETVSDTSDIAQRVFPGQFYKWTIQMELQDGFLFNLPYKPNMIIGGIELSVPSQSDIDGLEEIEMPDKN